VNDDEQTLVLETFGDAPSLSGRYYVPVETHQRALERLACLEAVLAAGIEWRSRAEAAEARVAELERTLEKATRTARAEEAEARVAELTAALGDRALTFTNERNRVLEEALREIAHPDAMGMSNAAREIARAALASTGGEEA
jgi:hypothetical protein